jgi:putative tryptophan/tyrosine transport system substrate-binding protein
MKRRDFIKLAGGITTWPLAAQAQDIGRVYRIGFFGPAQVSPPPIQMYRAFLAQMSELGFHEGKNLHVEFRTLEDTRGVSINADELVRARPDLIVVSGPAIALQSVVSKSEAIPIVVIAINFDPIAGGYVKSLSRPGGNITGVVFQQLELAQKQVELLTQAFPGRTRLTILFEAQSLDQLGPAERIAKSLNLQVQSIKIDPPTYDFDGALRNATADGAQMVLALSGPGWSQHRSRIAELAIRHRLPMMFIASHYTEAGGLISYGVDFPVMFSKAAEYTAKILKGEKAADLPIEQATKFNLVVNLKTAKEMGIKLPESILLRADRLIE